MLLWGQSSWAAFSCKWVAMRQPWRVSASRWPWSIMVLTHRGGAPLQSLSSREGWKTLLGGGTSVNEYCRDGFHLMLYSYCTFIITHTHTHTHTHRNTVSKTAHLFSSILLSRKMNEKMNEWLESLCGPRNLSFCKEKRRLNPWLAEFLSSFSKKNSATCIAMDQYHKLASCQH